MERYAPDKENQTATDKKRGQCDLNHHTVRAVFMPRGYTAQKTSEKQNIQ
jgi:hypothetical protein